MKSGRQWMWLAAPLCFSRKRWFQMLHRPSNRFRAVALSLAILAGVGLTSHMARADGDAAKLARQHLYAGTLGAGAAELAARAAAAPDDREARFALGLVRFAQAVEHLGQSLYRHGLRPPKSVSVPLLRFPVPLNPRPESITSGPICGRCAAVTSITSAPCAQSVRPHTGPAITRVRSSTRTPERGR